MATVECARCKKQVLATECWSVHNQGEKTFECTDTTCAETFPRLDRLFPIPANLAEPLADKQSNFYVNPWTDLVWKNTAGIWSRADKYETNYLLRAYFKWENEKFKNAILE